MSVKWRPTAAILPSLVFALLDVCTWKKSQICFYIISKTNGPKRRRRKIKKEDETLETFAAVLRNWGPVLVKHLWSDELPCESASLKDFPSAWLSHWNTRRYRFKSPPLYCIFWVWRAFEGEGRTPGFKQGVYVQKHRSGIHFQQSCVKAVLPLESLHSSAKLFILSRHPQVTSAGLPRELSCMANF